VGFDAVEIAPHLFAMSMSTEESLKEYLKLQLRVPLIARMGPVARTFDFVANAAPGVKEILTVGKLAHEVREANYDLVVVDASATGHIVDCDGGTTSSSEPWSRSTGQDRPSTWESGARST
jgi:anion-transporting  ArsA/GET3 family ATPase